MISRCHQKGVELIAEAIFCLHREATLFKLGPETDFVVMITKEEGGDTRTVSLSLVHH